jgi:hypothetical protein
MRTWSVTLLVCLVVSLTSAASKVSAGTITVTYTDSLFNYTIAYTSPWVPTADVTTNNSGDRLFGPVLTIISIPGRDTTSLVISVRSDLHSPAAVYQVEMGLLGDVGNSNKIGNSKTRLRHIHGMLFRDSTQTLADTKGIDHTMEVLDTSLGQVTYFLGTAYTTSSADASRDRSALETMTSSFHAYLPPPHPTNPLSTDDGQTLFVPWLGSPYAAYTTRYGFMPKRNVGNVFQCPHDPGKYEFFVDAYGGYGISLGFKQCPHLPMLQNWRRACVPFLPPDATYIGQAIVYGTPELHYRSKMLGVTLSDIYTVPDFTVFGDDQTNEWNMDMGWAPI